MKTFFALLALAALQDAQLSPGGSRDDARAIVELILTNEARIHTDHPEYLGPGCIRMQTEVSAFDETREMLSQLARDAGQNTGQRRERLRERSTLRSEYAWRQTSSTLGTRPEERAVDAELAQKLDETAHLIVQGHSQPRLVEQVDISWLRAPLRPCPSDRSVPWLRVSSPAFHGDVAFVETTFICGGLCGGGQLYALVRRETGWEIVATSFTWVS